MNGEWKTARIKIVGGVQHTTLVFSTVRERSKQEMCGDFEIYCVHWDCLVLVNAVASTFFIQKISPSAKGLSVWWQCLVGKMSKCQVFLKFT